MNKITVPLLRRARLVVVVLGAIVCLVPWCRGQGPASATSAAEGAAKQSRAADKASYPMELSPEGESIAKQLDKELAPGSEARAMFEAIMEGKRLTPRIGWFATATSQTRYSWPKTLERYDQNKDGTVQPSELPIDGKQFASIDRDQDGRLTQVDFDWDLAPKPEIKPEAKAEEKGEAANSKSEFVSNISRDLLIKGLKSQEIGSLQPGPNVGEQAPDFELNTVDGSMKIRLSELIGDKPVVLVFGNYTCAPFRRAAEGVKEVYDRYKDHAQFAMVYVREAHPSDGWRMNQGADKISLPQPITDSQRVEVAKQCQAHVGFKMPFLVDTVDDRVGSVYSGMPSRLYLIDQQGQVAYKSGRGPFGFKPAELEQALVLHLADRAKAK